MDQKTKRYVPNLIAPEHKVLHNYFKGTNYKPKEQPLAVESMSWFLGFILFFVALFNIFHFQLTLLFGWVAAIIFPLTQHWIEENLRFRITLKIKVAVSVVLIIIAIPLMGYYGDLDAKEEQLLQIAQETEKKEKVLAERKEQERKDSLSFYLRESDILKDKQKLEEASQKLNLANYYAATDYDREDIDSKRSAILILKSDYRIKKGQYKSALDDLTDLIYHRPKDYSLLYKRAVCYSKLGQIQNALNDLKSGIANGDNESQKLYDKLNPIKRKIIGSVTRCCDGSTSYATGRGACSHHHGVCDWNDPVYETYRKYE